MRRFAAVSWLWPLAIVLCSGSAGAATQYFLIDNNQGTAPVENACPIWIREVNHDDCTYNNSAPATPATSQWIGPVFSAGYYAYDPDTQTGAAPQVFQNTVPLDPQLAGTAIPIPIARGFISINDQDTTADGTDDVIGGTIEFGSFQRNISINLTDRAIESFRKIIHRLRAVLVNSATPNAHGGFDYVVGATQAGVAGFPTLLTGSSDNLNFPSLIASQSSADPADTAYWSAAGANGIAFFEGGTGGHPSQPPGRFLSGTGTESTAWGYSCDAGTGPGSCTYNGLLGGSNAEVSLDNVLLQISTDSAGHITSAVAFLVNYSDLSPAVPNADSWQATTLSFMGTETQPPLPLAFDDRKALENPNVPLDVLINDLPGVAPVTITIVTPPASGTADVVLTGIDANKILYTPDAASLPDSEQVIEYQIRDANGETSNAFLTVIVSDPVTCADDTAITGLNTPVTVDVLANDNGFNADPVILLANAQLGTAVVNHDLTITFTPPADTGGLFTIAYNISDGGSSSATCQVSVKVPPHAAPDTIAAEDHTATTLTVLANDSGVSPLTIHVTTAPAQGIYSLPAGSDTILYTPDAGFIGTDSLSYSLTDGDGNDSNVVVVTLNVSDSVPQAVNDTATAEDGIETVIDVLNDALNTGSPGPGADQGLADTPIVITIATPPVHGTVTVVPATPTVRSYVKYTSTAGFTGDDTFTYTLADADGDVSPAAATVTVTVHDSVPAADDDTADGSSRTFTAMHVLVGDTIAGDRPVTIEITQQPTLGTARVTTSGSGTTAIQDIEYKSNVGSAGTDSVKYRLHDADGSVSNEATVTITVANDIPAAHDDSLHNVEDGTPTTLTVLDDDMGTNNRLLTITITQQPTHGRVSVVAGTATSNPSVTYTPDGGFTGADSFRYSFRDADGDTSPTDALVPLNVNDSVPIANPDNRNGSSREAVNIDVLLNDGGLVDLPVTLQITQQPANGAAAPVTITRLNGTRWPGISYKSNLSSSGTDTVKYTVTDSDGDVSSEGTLTLTITNGTPVAVDDTGRTVYAQLNTPLGVLNNDTGIDNTPLTVTVTQQPAHGTATLVPADESESGLADVAYQSAPGYVGPDSLSYTVADADGQASAPATVAIQVISTPYAAEDDESTNQDTPVTVAVLANDGGLAYSPITVAIVGDPVNGTAVVNADNTITFTPKPGFTGQHPSQQCPYTTCVGGSFRYSITDSFNQRAEAEVLVDVFPGAVVDTGGSSSIDIELLALLAVGGAARRRLRSLGMQR